MAIVRSEASMSLKNPLIPPGFDPGTVRLVTKSRRMKSMGHVARMGEIRGAYRVLAVKPNGKRPLGRSRHGWEDNRKIYFKEFRLVGRGLD
jgi:hypothetical protein